MTIGKQIAQLRKQRKISQEELAATLHVSRQAISKWENGLSNPDTENLIRLSEVFNIDLDDLINCECIEEKRTSTPSNSDIAPAKYKIAICWLSVLLALALCAAIVFAGLWLVEKNTYPDASLESISPSHKTQWDSIKLYNGLLREEIPLSQEQQESLSNMIWNYRTAQTEGNANDEIIYGGICVDVEFVQDDIAYIWSFRPEAVYFTLILDDGKTINHQYASDWQLFQWIKTFIKEE